MLLDVQRAATCDIFVSNSDPTDSLFRSESAVRPWQSLLVLLLPDLATGCGRTNRIVGTERASCCDAYRSWRYPSLQEIVSIHVPFILPSSGRSIAVEEGVATYSFWRLWLGVWLIDDQGNSRNARGLFSVECRIGLASPNCSGGRIRWVGCSGTVM